MEPRNRNRIVIGRRRGSALRDRSLDYRRLATANTLVGWDERSSQWRPANRNAIEVVLRLCRSKRAWSLDVSTSAAPAARERHSLMIAITDPCGWGSWQRSVYEINPMYLVSAASQMYPCVASIYLYGSSSRTKEMDSYITISSALHVHTSASHV